MKTLFFVAWSTTLGGRAADDLAECRWFDLAAVTEADIEEEHKPLFEMLHASARRALGGQFIGTEEGD